MGREARNLAPQPASATPESLARVRVGTSGYSYKEWKGTFYPEKLPAGQMLSFYSARFRTVEINNTFYRMPSAKLLEGWAGQVPDDFIFVLKASQRITHFKRLKDAEGEIDYFLRTAQVLGPRLGPALFQLPPNFKKDPGRLASFLAAIPAPHRVAVEFRHVSWYDDEVFEILCKHNAALCVADTGEDGDAPMVATADWGYVRLRGVDYTPAELKKWASEVVSQRWKNALVFFKHEEKGTGPILAERFEKLLAA